MALLRSIPLGRQSLAIRARSHSRCLSTRASRVLSALGLPTDGSAIPGMYDGKWGGNGELQESICPTTGEVIGRVKTVSIGSALPFDLSSHNKR